MTNDRIRLARDEEDGHANLQAKQADPNALRTLAPDESCGAAPANESGSNRPLPNQVIAPVLDRDALAKLLGVSVRSVDRMRKRGQLPAPIIIGTRNPRWLAKEIEKWLEAGAPSGR
jgi:predicted DNA-binding transcriptional regulator AlpA